MYPTRGYWVEKDPKTGQYVYKPVEFITDGKRLLAMRQPDGRVKMFRTLRMGHTIRANACDYYIATCPTKNWTWVGPNMLGCITPNGVVPLHHQVRDIFAKRADVRDYLMSQNPRLTGYYCKRATTSSQLPSEREMEELQKHGPADHPTYPGMEDLDVPWFVQAALGVASSLNPLAGALMKSMVREGQWEELQVKARLPVNRYNYYRKLREYYTHLYAFRKISHEQWVQAERQLWRQMVAEAGLTPEGLIARSPHASQIVENLSRTAPQLGEYLRQHYQHILEWAEKTPVEIGPSEKGQNPIVTKSVPKSTIRRAIFARVNRRSMAGTYAV